MQHSIHDFVHEVGSARELAGLLGMKDQRGVWRVSQWLTRGDIPARVQLDHAATFRRLSQRIARKARTGAGEPS